MHFRATLVTWGVFCIASSTVRGLGTSCSSPLGPGTAASGDPYWLETIKHQGIAAYNPNPTGYQVFRNVKDFGAKGDDKRYDSSLSVQQYPQAIVVEEAPVLHQRQYLLFISRMLVFDAHVFYVHFDDRITPALVTYLVSAPIVAYYYTQLIGDAKNPPTLLASASFSGMAVIDADPYIPGGGGAQFYTNQNNFVPATDSQGTGIHWQVAQATSLMNIVFQMSTAADTAHQGIWMENGSGGFMGDLVFNGGKFGMWVGNQQFTVRNITVNNANTGIFSLWNWGWTFQGVHINNCQVGFDLATGGITQETQSTGAQAIIDATVANTPIFVRTSQASNGKLGGSIVLNNAELTNVPTAVGVVGGAVVLAGGTTTISSWGQGNIYHGTSSTSAFTQGNIHAANKPSVLLDGSGNIFGKTHPQYASYALSQFVSVRDNGAKGDGKTDDTAALNAIFTKYAGCKFIFFDAGTYIVTSTLTIPAGAQIVGEAWSVIAGSGSVFQDQANPQVVVRAGDTNSQGILEISDIVFTTVGPTPGAIVLEWNVRQPSGQNGAAGMWDSHIRLGGGEYLTKRIKPKL
ncbi:hypothetical protein C0993_005216 [Termitomyces sp. T159_Od127]|nr:hypothetical protein C0993_005216 [Termitomyces sp. T159_Od127]